MALIRRQAEDLIEIYRGRGLARSEPVQLARFSSELHRHPSVNRACAFHVCGVVLSQTPGRIQKVDPPKWFGSSCVWSAPDLAVGSKSAIFCAS